MFLPGGMIVMKFGGTSVGSAAAIRRVREIVGREVLGQKIERQPLVVVSALAGVTDALVEIGRRAPAGEVDLAAVEARHRSVLAELELPGDLVDPLLAEIADLVRGMRLVGEASPRALDALLSFGERLAARIVATHFAATGLPARAVDAWDAGLRTDSSFGRARPQPDDGRIARFFADLTELPVVTGFIAKDARGNITTLGRNGSDYSAALFGHALGAEEIQIWKDVDGVMTADPAIVPAAHPIRIMSFAEASEIAYYGSRVLHPAAILPAMEHKIPVRVLSTRDPSSPGTTILASYEDPGVAVRAIAHKSGVQLINLVTPHMLSQPGFLARVFAAAAAHEVDVDLVATSEVSITMTTDCGARDHADGLGAGAAAMGNSDGRLERFCAALGALAEVTIEPGQGMVCVVGGGIAAQLGVAARVLAALAAAEIPVRVISQGAIKVSIAMITHEQHLSRAVAALHESFFPAET